MAGGKRADSLRVNNIIILCFKFSLFFFVLFFCGLTNVSLCLPAVKDILQRLPVNMSLFCSGQMVSNDLMPTFLDPHLARASILPPPSVDLSFKGELVVILLGVP